MHKHRTTDVEVALVTLVTQVFKVCCVLCYQESISEVVVKRQFRTKFMADLPIRPSIYEE